MNGVISTVTKVTVVNGDIPMMTVELQGVVSEELPQRVTYVGTSPVSERSSKPISQDHWGIVPVDVFMQRGGSLKRSTHGALLVIGPVADALREVSAGEVFFYSTEQPGSPPASSWN